LTVLDDLGLVSTGKPAGSRVKPAMGTGTGTAKNTRGLPVQFTMREDMAREGSKLQVIGYCHFCLASPNSKHCQNPFENPRPGEADLSVREG